MSGNYLLEKLEDGLYKVEERWYITEQFSPSGNFNLNMIT